MSAKAYDLEQKLTKKDERIAALLHQVNRFKTQQKNAKKKKTITIAKQSTEESLDPERIVQVKIIKIKKMIEWQCTAFIVYVYGISIISNKYIPTIICNKK